MSTVASMTPNRQRIKQPGANFSNLRGTLLWLLGFLTRMVASVQYPYSERREGQPSPTQMRDERKQEAHTAVSASYEPGLCDGSSADERERGSSVWKYFLYAEIQSPATSLCAVAKLSFPPQTDWWR